MLTDLATLLTTLARTFVTYYTDLAALVPTEKWLLADVFLVMRAYRIAKGLRNLLTLVAPAVAGL